MFLQNGKFNWGPAGVDAAVGVSVTMLGTGKQSRGQKSSKNMLKSLVTSTAQFVLKIVVSVEEEWEDVTYASVRSVKSKLS